MEKKSPVYFSQQEGIIAFGSRRQQLALICTASQQRETAQARFNKPKSICVLKNALWSQFCTFAENHSATATHSSHTSKVRIDPEIFTALPPVHKLSP